MVTASTYSADVSKKSDSVNMSRVRPWHPQRPHNALAELPPAIDPETKVVLKRCVTRVALADLNRAAELIPRPRMLEVSLPLLEAQARSEIENIVTSADTLFRHVGAADAADAATREALRYRTALLGPTAVPCSTWCSSNPTAASPTWWRPESQNARLPHAICMLWSGSECSGLGGSGVRSSSFTRSSSPC